jgi:MerR family copper efflux transcriptional regulator
MSLTIGQAAAQSGVPAKTIRYYESIGLIGTADRRDNRYRDYDETDVATLRFIGRARRLGFSTEDLRALLALYRDRSRSSRDVKAIALQHIARIDSRMQELKKIRATLTHLAAQCEGGDRPDCPIIDELAGEH